MKKTMGALLQRPLYMGLTVVLVVVMAMPGCAKKIPHSLVPEYEKRNIRYVAVMPVLDKAGNPDVSVLLRQRVVEALYFKGYPKIPTGAIDQKLAVLYKNDKKPTPGDLSPRDVGSLLGVDAVLFSTLADCKTSFLYLYAPTSVAVSFEMYNARTGELLWKTGHQTQERNFDLTPDRLKMKSCQVFEPALQQIVNKATETLPDGPDA